MLKLIEKHIISKHHSNYQEIDIAILKKREVQNSLVLGNREQGTGERGQGVVILVP